MKNKNTFIASLLLSLTILSTFAGISVLAVESDKVAITTTEELSKGRAIVRLESPTIASLEFSSSLSGRFNYEDMFGNTLTVSETVPDSSEAELYYPLRTDITNDWYHDELNEYNAYYATVENNSMEYGDYDVKVNSESYSLKIGGEYRIIYPTDLVTILKLNVRKSGVYQIWLADLNYNAGDVVIIGPDGQDVDFFNDQLPDNQRTGGVTLGKYLYFAAFAKGVYQMYIPTADDKIKIKCEYHEPRGIAMGSSVDVGPDPFSTTFMDPKYTLDVYSVNVRAFSSFYSYFYDIEFGGPVDKIFYNLGSATQIVNLNEGLNQMLPMITTGSVYIVVDNPDYFNWADDGIQESQPVKYSVLFNAIPAQRHAPNSEETISVTKSQGAVARSINIDQPSIISMEFVDIGASSPNLYTRGGKILFKNRDGVAFYPEIQELLDSYVDRDCYIILAEPGTYFCAFIHSNSGTPEYMKFATKVTPVGSGNVLTKDPDGWLPRGEFTDIKTEQWEGLLEDTNQGILYGNGAEFSIDENFWNWEYNITLDPEKNPDVFDKNTDLDLGVLWDDGTNSFINYTEEIQPGNDTLVPFTDQTYGDAFIIGSEDKFSAIDLEILSAATGNNYYWQYWSGFWESFSPTSDGFIDGTNNGTHSLAVNGTISWNPATGDMNSWEIYNGGGSTGSELPDTGGKDLYLIRCWCNSGGQPIPQIRQITNIEKFVGVRFDLDAWVSFDTVTGRGRAYYPVDHHSWNNNFGGNGNKGWSAVDNANNMRFNFEERDAILSLAVADLYIYDYRGNEAGNAYRFNDSLTWSFAVYPGDVETQMFSYDVGDNVATKFSVNQNLTTLPSDQTFSFNASELDYVYVAIDPRNVYDWTQINLGVVNGTITDAKLIFPNKYSYETIDNLIATYNSGIFDVDVSFSDYYSSGGLPEANYNMSMEFGCVTDIVYLELAVTTGVPENLTYVNMEVNQFDLNMIVVGLPGFPTWAIVLIVIGGVAVVGVIGWFIYKKKNPGARIDLSKLKSKLKLGKR